MTNDQLLRFLPKVSPQPTGCWEWTASKCRRGYGRMGIGDVPRLAHRLSYEHFIGPIPEGSELDHLCRNTSCVNPTHLEAVPHAVNVRRGPRANVTHCKQGHPYDAENTYTHRNMRSCRTCRASANEKYEASGKRKAA